MPGGTSARGGAGAARRGAGAAGPGLRRVSGPERGAAAYGCRLWLPRVSGARLGCGMLGVWVPAGLLQRLCCVPGTQRWVS